MLKKILISLMTLTLLLGCVSQDEKPKISISQYAKQVTEMNIVIDKLMNEPNPKTLHDMAFGVESTRVVLCDPIGDECNLYYKLINKMVFVTNDGELSDNDKVLLEKMKNELQSEIKRTEDILIKDWEKFITKNPENK